MLVSLVSYILYAHLCMVIYFCWFFGMVQHRLYTPLTSWGYGTGCLFSQACCTWPFVGTFTRSTTSSTLGQHRLGLGSTLLIFHSELLMENIMTPSIKMLAAKGLSLAEMFSLWIRKSRYRKKIYLGLYNQRKIQVNLFLE